MKDSPSKTICFFHSASGWSEEEQQVLAACKEEMRQGNKVILIANMHSQLAVRAIQERVDVYRFRLSGMNKLNPLTNLIFLLFFKVKKIDSLITFRIDDMKKISFPAKILSIKLSSLKQL